MKSIDKALITSCLIGLFFSCNNSTESNTGTKTREIDMEHQLIDMSIDWDKKQLLGNTTISMFISRPTDSVVLDASKLLIESVVLENGRFLNFKTDNRNNKLKIGLDKKYRVNDRLKLSIKYRTEHINQSDPNNIWGSFGKGLRFFKPTMTDKDRRQQVWAIGEPDLNSYWFPSINDPMDLRTTELIGTIKDTMMIISSGELVSTVKNEDNTISYHWQSNSPHSNQNISLIVGSYSNFQQKYKNITINNYSYPDEVEGTSASVIMLPEIMEYYSDFTDLSYPYPTYSQIFVQDFAGWKGGVMNAIITENMIDDKTTHEDFLYLWDVVEGEALAYQWFGNNIKPKEYKDIWLSKAFCRHLSSLFNQQKNGNEEFLLYQLSPDLSTYLSDWNVGIPTLVVPDEIEGLEAFVNGNAPYTKGALVLNMLRKQMGEAKWKEVFEKYVAKYSGKMVATESFIEVVNEVNREPLDWFFNQWVYGIGHPIFEVSEKYDVVKKEYILDVQQIQKVDSVINGNRIPLFQGKMILEIDDRLEEIFIKPQEQNIFKFVQPEPPKLVNFDFEDTWIREVVFSKTDKQILEELARTKDVLHRAYCMQELAKTASDSLTDSITKLKIMDALRGIAESKGYWRTRLIALWHLQSIASASMKGGKVSLDTKTIDLLLKLIRNESSWLKANAINLLGMTCDKRYTPIYLEALNDYSDRVVFMGAIALGKTKDPKALDALLKLPEKPSWKNQSLISALYGLKELKDPRGIEISLKSLTDSEKPHWNLATPIWDHRLAAAHALVALEKSGLGHQLIQAQLQNAMVDGNINDILYNALLTSILKDPKGETSLNELEMYFKDNKEALKAIANYKSVYQ